MGRPDNTLETMYAIGEKKIKVFKNEPSKICGTASETFEVI